MGLAQIDLTKLMQSARAAAKSQWQNLGTLQKCTTQLEVVPLSESPREISSIGVVAADAGLVSVALAPFAVEFLHVADSEGHIHLSEIFPLTTVTEDLRAIFSSNPLFQRFSERLGIDWMELSPLWSRRESSLPFPEDVRVIADTLRELAEWAVCMDLAAATPQGNGPQRLVLHDGLLSSVLLWQDTLNRGIPEWWREYAWRRKGACIAGVGKSSILWQRLSLVLDLDPHVEQFEECYIVIPAELEAALMSRKPGSRRIGFGQLVLLKTELHQPGGYLAVDLPPWVIEDRGATSAVLGEIARVSKTTFPRPGYPAPLGRAHEAAHLTEFEAKVIRDQVVSALNGILEAKEFERVLRNWAFQPQQWEKQGRIGRL